MVVITTGMLLASRDAVKHPPGHRTTSQVVETLLTLLWHISSGRSGFEFVFFFNIYSHGLAWFSYGTQDL